MKILYIDLNTSGISGDMFLACLLGLVSEPEKILKKLKELQHFLPGVSKLDIELKRPLRSGLQINQLNIDIKENKDRRSAKILQESLKKYLDGNKLSDQASNYAINVLNSLIQAEAEVHGVLAESIHLHELSSIDTLVDILGVTLALEDIGGFNPDFNIYCSKIPLGGGKINTAHGIITIPAPATLKILEKSNLITFGGPIESELVTPTGAALLINLNPQFMQHPPEMIISKSVYSAGQKEFKDFLNILRIFYGKSADTDSSHILHKYVEEVTVLETDVDDVSGELLGNFINDLKMSQVLDIQIIPSLTKKNRPSHIIKVLCYPQSTFEITEKIIQELGTLGVRYCTMKRVCVERTIEKREIEIKGKIFEVNFKMSYIESVNGREIVNFKPEYEDLKKISEDLNIPLRKIQSIIQTQITQFFPLN
ncbi:MAG: nickel pincer cofactor biosynthesis protein LarC [Promethearchaeota archaeon]